MTFRNDDLRLRVPADLMTCPDRVEECVGKLSQTPSSSIYRPSLPLRSYGRKLGTEHVA